MLNANNFPPILTESNVLEHIITFHLVTSFIFCTIFITSFNYTAHIIELMKQFGSVEITMPEPSVFFFYRRLHRRKVISWKKLVDGRFVSAKVTVFVSILHCWLKRIKVSIELSEPVWIYLFNLLFDSQKLMAKLCYTLHWRYLIIIINRSLKPFLY